MSKDLNQCNFIGRLGKDVDLRYTPSGSAVANFSIACGDDYKNKEGVKVDKTNWINFVAFGRLAEVCGEYLKKGSQVFVSGKFTTDEYEKDGVKRYSTKIIIREMQMLDSKSNSSQQGGGQPQYQPQAKPQQGPQQAAPAPMDDDFDDDLPF